MCTHTPSAPQSLPTPATGRSSRECEYSRQDITLYTQKGARKCSSTGHTSLTHVCIVLYFAIQQLSRDNDWVVTLFELYFCVFLPFEIAITIVGLEGQKARLVELYLFFFVIYSKQ